MMARVGKSALRGAAAAAALATATTAGAVTVTIGPAGVDPVGLCPGTNNPGFDYKCTISGPAGGWVTGAGLVAKDAPVGTTATGNLLDVSSLDGGARIVLDPQGPPAGETRTWEIKSTFAFNGGGFPIKSVAGGSADVTVPDELGENDWLIPTAVVLTDENGNDLNDLAGVDYSIDLTNDGNNVVDNVSAPGADLEFDVTVLLSTASLLEIHDFHLTFDTQAAVGLTVIDTYTDALSLSWLRTAFIYSADPTAGKETRGQIVAGGPAPGPSVPEPATLLLLGAGLLGLGAARRRSA